MLHWEDPVGFLKGVTPAVRKAWSALDIQTIGELLQTYPRRYDDYSTIVPIHAAEVGMVVTVKGMVAQCRKLPTFRKRMQLIRCVLKDETGSLSVTFFNQPWLLEELTIGREIFLSGKVTHHPDYGKSMAKPLWEPGDRDAVAAGQVAPVYPLTGSLTQKTYRRLVHEVLGQVVFPEDPLSASTRQEEGILGLAEAYRAIHAPLSMREAEDGRRRLAFDECVTYRLALGYARNDADAHGAPGIPVDTTFAKRFVSALPFDLTDDQKKAVWACMQAMDGKGTVRPMRRLLQGDVGAGKTLVAAFLMAHVQRHGWSAAMLAPTDILARQHAASLRRLCAPHHIPVLLLTRTERLWTEAGESRPLAPSEIPALLERGQLLVVGTHALLQPGRLPADLAFAVVDEQHRFGVEQREALSIPSRRDGRVPHFLSMTATPIPRSLALSLYGDLEVTVLRSKPPGRTPITTQVCIGEARERAYQAVCAAVQRGEQAFVVCPLIDASDDLGVRAATDEWMRLKTGPFAGLRVGLLHGRQKSAEKDAVMEQFSGKQLDVLVSTAVIEVGVDVPNATVMLIEGAERFGLAQLHQFRGRVGRSSLKSACFLLTDAGGTSLERLQILEKTEDGFALAEYDLQLRGSGNLMGTAQSGATEFKAARLTDIDLLTRAKGFAETCLKEDPTLSRFPLWQARVEALRRTAHLE